MKDIEAAYLRDDARVTRNEYRKTDIAKETVNLDNYSKMNATFVKQPFTSKTISELNTIYEIIYFRININEVIVSLSLNEIQIK